MVVTASLGSSCSILLLYCAELGRALTVLRLLSCFQVPVRFGLVSACNPNASRQSANNRVIFMTPAPGLLARPADRAFQPALPQLGRLPLRLVDHERPAADVVRFPK